ncbi:MAG: hypothetical protein ACKO3B_02980 [Bacteroidota bacterium]
MLRTCLLVDDETLFHLVFEDACFLFELNLKLTAVDSTEKAELMLLELKNNSARLPDCIFVDYYVEGSTRMALN